MFEFLKYTSKIKEQKEYIILLQKEISALKNQQSNMISLDKLKSIINSEIEKNNQQLVMKKQEIEEKDIHITKLKNRISILETQLNNKEYEIQELNKKLTSLTDKIADLQKEIDNRNKKSEKLKLKDRLAEEQERIKEYEQNQEDEYYKNHLEEYYYFRDSIFCTQGGNYEQRLYYCLNVWANKHKIDKYNNRYEIFTKIRISDIIHTKNEKEHEKETYETKYGKYHPMVYEITSKHIDFIICERIYGKDSKKDTYYKPLVFIELNGDSHKINERTKKNDAFKRNLFNALNRPIITIQNTTLDTNLTEYANGELSNILEKSIKSVQKENVEV